MEVLSRKRLEGGAFAGCFSLPVKELAKALRRSSADVHKKLCSMGNGAVDGTIDLATVESGFFAMFGWDAAPQSGADLLWIPKMIQLPKSAAYGSPELDLSLAGRREATWAGFESPHRSDRIALAIQFHGYGARGRATDSSSQQDKWFLTGPLHASAVGILRRLLPSVEISILGFSGCSPKTTKAGAFETLFDFYRKNPDHAAARSELQHHVASLITKGRLARGRGASNLALSSAFQLIGGEDKPTASAEDFPELDRLFDLAGGGKGNFRRAIVWSTLLIWKLLLLPGRRGFLRKSRVNDVSAKAEVTDLQHHISDVFREDRDVQRSVGARFPILRLLKSIPLIALNARRGMLCLPDVLQDWIAGNFHFHFVVPLYHVSPQVSPSRQSEPVFSDADNAAKQFPALFSPLHQPETIAADCRPLLVAASESLGMGSGAQPRGWLTNRISETNEMLVYLAMQIGREATFPLSRLPFALDTRNPGSDKNLSLLLNTLDSRLILRCVLEKEGGEALISNWCSSLAERAIASLRPKKEDTGYLAHDERMDACFSFFRDEVGLAAAALDVLRLAQNGEQADDSRWVVYFQPSIIRQLFRPRAGYRTRGNQESRESDAITMPSIYRDCGLKAKMLLGNLDVADLARIFLDWEKEEGLAHGEQAQDLLNDFVAELEREGKFDAAAQAKVRNLRAILDVARK